MHSFSGAPSRAKFKTKHRNTWHNPSYNVSSVRGAGGINSLIGLAVRDAISSRRGRK